MRTRPQWLRFPRVRLKESSWRFLAAPADAGRRWKTLLRSSSQSLPPGQTSAKKTCTFLVLHYYYFIQKYDLGTFGCKIHLLGMRSQHEWRLASWHSHRFWSNVGGDKQTFFGMKTRHKKLHWFFCLLVLLFFWRLGFFSSFFGGMKVLVCNLFEY